jgi:hypothetical protein
MSEWHALAKLRMHTEDSLSIMEECTTELGRLLCQFRDLTCSQFSTFELSREADARARRRKGTAMDTLGGEKITQPLQPNARMVAGKSIWYPAYIARSKSNVETRLCMHEAVAENQNH